MTISLFKRKSAVAQMLSVLKKFGTDAHLYLPGVGVISGVTAGNYLDSIGTTHASVDGLVGLVLDGAGSVGAEIMPGAWGTQTGYVVSGDTITVNSSAVQYSILFSSGAATTSVVNKTYRIRFNIVSGNPGDISVKFGVSAIGYKLGVNEFNLVATSAWDVPYLQCLGATGANNVVINSISIKEVTGIHASQATTGNKPRLRRGLVNLQTYSNDFSNAVWGNWLLSSTDSYTRTAPDGTSTAVEFTTSGAGGKYNGSATVVAGITYTSAAWMKKVAGNLRLVVASQAAYGGTGGDRYVDVNGDTGAFISKHADVSSYSIYSGGNGWYLIAGTFTPTSSATSPMAVYTQTAGTIQAWRAGRFRGTPTAQQIQAAGGIPVTTTAPASSNTGAYYWEAESQDHLSLSAPLFGIADDHVVVAGGERVNATGNQGLFCPAASATWGRIASIQYENTGRLAAWYVDDANVSSRSVIGNPLPPATPFVASVRAVGGTAKLRRNGVEEGAPVNLAGIGTITPNAAFIGKGATGGDFWQGKIYPALTIKGTVSDAQLLIFERGINALSGYAAGRF